MSLRRRGWKPVFRNEPRKIKELGSVFDSIKNEKTLERTRNRNIGTSSLRRSHFLALAMPPTHGFLKRKPAFT
ncbi:hypothetical protein MnTg02_01338 [bacterium MnTg02]|nr:hypothetical protein MnTg02_01338 [bacterium MnTg02]